MFVVVAWLRNVADRGSTHTISSTGPKHFTKETYREYLVSCQRLPELCTTCRGTSSAGISVHLKVLKSGSQHEGAPGESGMNLECSGTVRLARRLHFDRQRDGKGVPHHAPQRNAQPALPVPVPVPVLLSTGLATPSDLCAAVKFDV